MESITTVSLPKRRNDLSCLGTSRLLPTGKANEQRREKRHHAILALLASPLSFAPVRTNVILNSHFLVLSDFLFRNRKQSPWLPSKRTERQYSMGNAGSEVSKHYPELESKLEGKDVAITGCNQERV